MPLGGCLLLLNFFAFINEASILQSILISNHMGKVRWHNSANFQDSLSISFVSLILSGHSVVMPKLDSIDKWPNIDWFVEIQDNGSFFGRLHVQVKTLPVSHGNKFLCPVSFLEYCRLDPTLLLCVDNTNEKIYWLYIDEVFLSQIDISKVSVSKTIALDRSKYLDKVTTWYIQDWKEIAERFRNIRIEYPETRKAYELLSKTGNEIIWLDSGKFKQIHEFLDYINNKLDSEFRSIKTLLYPDQWKLWIGYYIYEADSLEYLLYSIPIGRNDAQIKSLTSNSEKYLEKHGIQISLHAMSNPIESNPILHARVFIKDKILECLETKMLDHNTSNKILAAEYIFAFIDRFHEQMWLSPADSYGADEIRNACKYLIAWLKECLNLLLLEDRNNFKSRLHNWIIRYFDPDWKGELSEDEKLRVQENTKIHLAGISDIVEIPIGMRGFSYNTFHKFLDSLDPNEIIIRPYIIRNYERWAGWLYWVFSKEDSLKNLTTILENFPIIYTEFIKSNFPKIETSLWWINKGGNIVLVYFSLRDTYSSMEECPVYKFYHLQLLNNIPDKQMILLSDKEHDDLIQVMWTRFRDTPFIYKWNTYKIVATHSWILDFLYEETPIFNLIYTHLIQRVKDYFKEN